MNNSFKCLLEVKNNLSVFHFIMYDFKYLLAHSKELSDSKCIGLLIFCLFISQILNDIYIVKYCARFQIWQLQPLFYFKYYENTSLFIQFSFSELLENLWQVVLINLSQNHKGWWVDLFDCGTVIVSIVCSKWQSALRLDVNYILY